MAFRDGIFVAVSAVLIVSLVFISVSVANESVSNKTFGQNMNALNMTVNQTTYNMTFVGRSQDNTSYATLPVASNLSTNISKNIENIGLKWLGETYFVGEENIVINLSEHLTHSEECTPSYFAKASKNIYTALSKEILTVLALNSFEGNRTVTVIATCQNSSLKQQIAVSFVPKTNVLPANLSKNVSQLNTTIVVTENVSQGVAIIGQAVNWTKNVIIHDSSDKELNLTVDIPKEAQNLRIAGRKFGTQTAFARISLGRDSKTNKVVFSSRDRTLRVEYQTQAPRKIESNKTIRNDKITKKITISSNATVHYSNVIAYTNISDSEPTRIHLYWQVNGTMIEITHDSRFNTSFFDSNNNSLIDRIRWIVPQLSEQNFSVVIDLKILNVQSYPVVGGEWTVGFNTTGIADLVITPVNGTTWNSPNSDLTFLGIRCGDKSLTYETINASIVLKNYSCNLTGYETTKVLTTGKHTLKFQFGTIVEYAKNYATGAYLILFTNETSTPAGWVCISCDSTGQFYNRFPRGNTTYGSTGGATTHTHTISLLAQTQGASAQVGGTTAAESTSTHVHPTISSTSVSTASNMPLYRALRVIKYTGGIPTVIPRGTIAIFNTTTLPSGWTRYSLEDNRFVFANSSTSQTGGASNHTHTISYTVDASGNTQTSGGFGTSIATPGHTHTVSGTSNRSDNRPPYIQVILARANADTSIPRGLIAIFNASPYAVDWTNMSNTGGKLYGRFIVGAPAFGTTGGSSSHNNPNTNLTSSTPTGTTTDTGSGKFQASGGHTHWVTVSFSTVSNLPPYINVIFSYANKPLGPPVVTLNSPRNNYVNSTITVVKLYFNCSIRDDFGSKNLSLYLTNKLNLTLKLNDSCNLPTVNGSCRWLKNLTPGNYTWNCLGFDNSSISSMGINRTIVIIQSLPPTVRLLEPGNKNFSKSPVLFHYNVTSTSLDTCQLWANFSGIWKKNQTNVSASRTSLNVTKLLSLKDGTYKWNAWCNDSNTLSAWYSYNRTVFVDSTFPSIKYAGGTPANNTFSTKNYFFVNLSVFDVNFANVTFRLYNTSSRVLINTTTRTVKYLNFTKLNSNSVYYFNVSVIDRAGNRNKTLTWKITLDSIQPYVAFAGGTAANNSFFNRNYIYVNVTFIDQNKANLTFYLFNSSRNLVNATTKLTNNINFTKLNSNMFYFYNVSVIDKTGSLNHTLARKITFDSVQPYIAFAGGTPQDNTYSHRDYFFINVSAYDLNEKNITFYLYNTTKLVNATTKSAGSRSINFTKLSSNNFFYNVTVFDRAGNKNVTPTRHITLDNTPKGGFLILFWNGTDIPSGWSCISCSPGDAFYNKFPRGNSSFNLVGGVATHTHTLTLVAQTQGAAAQVGGTATARSTATHVHPSISGVSVETVSNMPDYRALKMIRYNKGMPDTLPGGVIAIFNTTTLPSGWTRYSMQDGHFILANSSPTQAGGANQHDHGITFTVDASANSQLSGGTGTTIATTAHTHTVSGNSEIADNSPPYVEVVLAQANSETEIPLGMIAMFNASPVGQWLNISKNGQPFAGRFLVGSDTPSVFGGNSSHHNPDTNLTSGGPSATTSDTGAGVFQASGTHTHWVTVSFSVASNLPPFTTVVFGYAVDTIKPTVSLNRPNNRTVSYTRNNSFVYTPNDNRYLKSCSLIINDKLNRTNYTITKAVENTIKINLSYGTWRWTVNCTDFGGNTATNKSIRTLYIDEGAPYITIISLSPNPANHSLNTVYINWSARDAFLNYTYVNVSFPNSSFMKKSTVNFTLTPLNLPVLGKYRIRFFAMDRWGNYNLTDKNLTVRDVLPPTLTLYTPTNKSFVANSTVTFTYNISDISNISNCSLFFVGVPGAIKVNRTVNKKITQKFVVTGLSENTYDWFVNCTDKSNNTGHSLTRRFTIDITQPSVVLNQPANYSYDSDGYVQMGYTPNDPGVSHLQECDLWANFTAPWKRNETDTSPRELQLNLFRQLHLQDGSYKWDVRCNDSAGNIAWYYRNFTLFVDSTPPSVLLLAPKNRTFSKSKVLTFNYTLNEKNPQICEFWGNFSSVWKKNQTDLTPKVGLKNTLYLNLSEGYYKWNIWCNDSAHNHAWNNTNYTLAVDTSKPSVVLQNPANNSWLGFSNNPVIFQFVANDVISSIKNCSLILNNTINQTNVTILENVPQTFRKNLTSGYRRWQVNCSDLAFNKNNSQTWLVKIDLNFPSAKSEAIQSKSLNVNSYQCLNLTASDALSGVQQVYAEVTKPKSGRVNISLSNATGGCGHGGGKIWSSLLLADEGGNYNWSRTHVWDNALNKNSTIPKGNLNWTVTASSLLEALMTNPKANLKINESGQNNWYNQTCNVKCTSGQCKNVTLVVQYNNATWHGITTKTTQLISPLDNFSCNTMNASSPLWWNYSYSYRKRINLTRTGTVTVLANYTINISLDTQTLMSQKKLMKNCSDLRIVYWDGSKNIQLDRINNTKCNSTTSQWLFRTKPAISISDANYYVYYGNNRSGPAPTNLSRIYAFWEPFQTLSLWTIRSGDEPYVFLNNTFGSPAPSLQQIPSLLANGDTRIRATNFTSTNMTLEYDVYLGANGRTIHQFFFRSSGFAFTNGYAWRLQTVNADGGWFRIATGTWTAIGTAYAAVTSGWHHVKLRILGSNLSAWVDYSASSNYVVDTTTLVSGYVGSHVHGTTSWKMSNLDNLKIRYTIAALPKISLGSEQSYSSCNHTFTITSGSNSGGNKWPVRCLAVSSNAPTVYSSSFNITINDHPKARFTLPKNNSWIAGNARLNASNSTDDLGIARYYFYVDNNSAFSSPSLICQTSDKNCSLNTVTQTQCTQNLMGCYLMLNLTDSDGLKNATIIEVGIDNAVPQVQLKRPLNFSNLTGATYLVNASIIDTGSGVNTALFLYRQNKLSAWQKACSDTDRTAPYQCSWNLASVSEGNQIMVRVVANDTVNNKKNDTVYNLTVDKSGPYMKLRSPKNNSWSLSSVTFIYNVSDLYSAIRNCSLILNKTRNQTSYYVPKNKNQNFSATLSQGSWVWQINCTDTFGNVNKSIKRLLHIDTTGPVSTLTKPVNYANITGNPYTVTATVTDNGVGVNMTVFYYRANNSDSWKKACTDADGSPYQCSWSLAGLANKRTYEIFVRSNDTLGNLGNSDVHTNITVDTLAPNVTLISPPNMSQDIDGNITFIYQTQDATSGVKNCTLILRNKRNATNSSITEGVYQEFEIVNLKTGNWSWTVNCTDYSGNTGTIKPWNVSVAPDNSPPTIYLISPPVGSTDADGTVYLDYNVSDILSDIKNCTLLINGTVNQTQFTPPENTKNTFTVYNLVNGFWRWAVRCTDTAISHNTATSKSRNFTVKRQPFINITVRTDKKIYERGNIALVTVNTTDAFNNPLNTSAISDIIVGNTSLPWWNITFKSRKPIYLNETSGTNRQNVIVEVNITKLGGNITKCYQVRIVKNNSLTFSAVSARLLYGDNVTYCYFGFRLNLTANVKRQNNYYVYYNNSAATDQGIPPVYYLQQVFFDDFETAGVLTGWARNPAAGSDWTEQSGAVCDGGAGFCAYTIGDGTNHNIENVTDLSNYRDCLLKFRYKYNLFEAADSWLAQYNNGTVLTTLQTYSDGGDDNLWHSAQFNLTPYKLSSGSRIILREQMSAGTDYLWIDNVNISCIGKSNLNIRHSVGLSQQHINRTANITGADGLWFLLWNTEAKRYANYSAVTMASRANYNSRSAAAWFEIVKDKTPPRVTLVNPPNATWLNSSKVILYYKANDDASPISNCSLILNGRQNQTNKTIKRNQIYNFTVGLSDRKYNWTVNCSDDDGNVGINNTRRIFFVDTTKPTVILLFPPYQYNTSKTTLVFNFTVKDNMDKNLTCNLTIDQVVRDKNFDAKNGSVTNRTIASLGYGNHKWNVSCWDNSHNRNTSSTRTFVIDNRLPKVFLYQPLNHQWKNTNAINFNYTVIDDYPKVCVLWANFTGAWKKNQSDNSPTNKTRKIIGPVLVTEGSFKWNVNCTDYSGNSAFNSTNLTFQVDTTLPKVAFDTGTLADNSYRRQNYIFVNVTVLEKNEANVTFRLYNTTGLVNSTTLPAATRKINFTKLNSNKVYFYNVTVADKAGNTNQTLTRKITLDTILPYVAFAGGTAANNSYFNINYVFVNVSFIDTNKANLTFYLYNSSYNLINATTRQQNNINFTKLNANMIYYYNMSAIDKAGNRNHTLTRKITLDSTMPYIYFSGGTPANNSFLSRNYIYVNVTVRDSNERNITFRIYNITKLVNSTTLPAGYRSINFTKLNSNKAYFINVTVFDKGGNQNRTSTRKITLDTTPPTARLDAPLNRSWQKSSVTFRYTPFDSALDACALYLNQSGWKANNTNTDVQSGIQYSVTVNFKDGAYKWNVWCNDTAKNSAFNSTNLTFIVDTLSPVVNFVYPTPQTNYNQSSRTVVFNATHTELNPQYLVFYLNSTKNYSKLYSGKYTNFTRTSLKDGLYTYYVWVNDSGSNYAQTETRTIRIDTQPPTVNLQMPLNRTWRSNATSIVLFKYNVSDKLLSVVNCSLVINGTRNQTQKPTGQFVSQNFTQRLSSGYYKWWVNCSDSLYNKNSSYKRYLWVDKTFPVLRNPNVNRTFMNVTQYICLNITLSDTFSGVKKAWAHVKQPNGFFVNIPLFDNQTTSCDKQNANSVYSASFRVGQRGTYNWTVGYANDTAGNLNSTYIGKTWNATSIGTLTVNMTSPKLNFTINESDQPRNYTYYQQCLSKCDNKPQNCSEVTLYAQYNYSTASDISKTSLFLANRNNSYYCGNLTAGGAACNFTFTIRTSIYSGASSWRVWCRAESSDVGSYISKEKVNLYVNDHPKAAFSYPTNASWLAKTEKLNATASTDDIGIALYSFALDNRTDFASQLVLCSSSWKNCTFDTLKQNQCANESLACFLKLNVTDSYGLRNITVLTAGIDNKQPRVNLVAPPNNSVTGKTVKFRYIPTDRNLDDCILYHNSSGWKQNLSNTSVISGIQQTFTIALRNGVFKWNVWCNDTKGNSAFNRTNYTVFVDGLPPKVMLVAPANNSWSWENVTFFYNVSDVLSNITNCSLVINNKLNVTSSQIDKDTTLYFNVHDLAQANYYWRVNCTDFFGNQNSSAQRKIRIDTTGPVSILDRPRNFTNVSSDYLKLNASAVDAGVGNIAIVRFEYRQNVSSAWSYACLDTDQTMPFNCTWNITGLPDSNQYQLRVFANDSLGNLGAANVHANITVDRKPPTVMLVLPKNNGQDTDGNVLFQYNVTDQTSLIKNCSLILNGKLNTTNKAVTKGTTQSFQLNGLAQANYTWQVQCIDYSLNKNSSNTRNLTVAPDKTPPVVMLISPKNHSIYTKENVVFVFNVTDELSGVKNCTLILNYKKNQSLKSVQPAVPQQFIQTLSDGNYTWRVNCTDNSTGYYNVGHSAIFNLTVRKATAIIVKVYGYYTLYETGEQAFFRTNTSDVYATKMDTNLTIFIINRSVSLPWWNSSFRYRKKLNITRNQTTLLANSTINFTFNTQTLISQSKMRSDGLDLRIAWFNNQTNNWQELDRLVYNINSPSTTVMFKTQANLTVSDSNYYVYYGNSSMTDAPVDKSGIYLYYDNFDSDTLSTYSKTAAFTQSQEDTDNIFRYNSTKRWVNVISNSSKGKSLRKSFPSAKDVVVEADQYLEKDQGVYSKLELAARVSGLAYYTFFASSNIIYSALLRYNSTGQGTQLDSVNQQFGTKGVWRHLKFIVYDNATGVVLKAYVDSTKLFEDVDSSSKQLSSPGSFGTGEYQLVGRIDNITVRRYISRKPLSSIGAEETLVYRRTNATGSDGTDYFKWNTTKQALSNYTIVSLASNPDYRNGYGYYQFRIGPHVLPPQITLKLPVNGENITNGSVMFSWIANDRVDTNVSCNLTINGIVRAKVPTLKEVQTNYSYSNLAEGFNYWNVTCIDRANNANTSKRWSLVVVMAPRYFSAILAKNNRSVVLNWSNVSYADYFAVYIGKNYSYFYSSPNATLKQLNWTDQNSAGDIKKFYRLSVARGKVRKFHNDTVGKHVILLYPEWNMVSLPLALKNYVLKNATNNGYNPPLGTKGCITEIWRYNSTRTSVWEETLYESGYWNPASGSGNFTKLSPYSGYWFYNNRTFNCNYTVVGTVARKNTTVHLNQNYNLVGWHSEDSPTLPMYCAPAYPLQVSPVNSIKYTYYYDPILDSFSGAMHFEYSGCSNNDWGWWPSTYPSSLVGWEPTKGYYLKTTQIADWTLVSLK